MNGLTFADAATRLYDTETDQEQDRPLQDAAVSARLSRALARHFAELDAPPEMYARFGLQADRGRNTE